MSSGMALGSASRQRGVGAPANLALMALAVGLIPPVLGVPAGEGLAWSVMATVIVAPLALYRPLRLEAFHPYSYVVFLGITSFVIPAFVVLVGDAAPVGIEEFQHAALLIAGAFAGYWLGFSAGIGVSVSKAIPLLSFRRVRKQGTSTVLTMSVLLYALGWVGRLTAASVGYIHLPSDIGSSWQLTGVFGYLDTFAVLSYAVLLSISLAHIKKGGRGVRSRLIPFVLALVALEILAGAITGSRSKIILPLLYAAMIFHFSYRPIRWRTLLLGWIVAFLVALPFLSLYRSAYYSELGSGSTPGVGAVSTAVESVETNLGQGVVAERREASVTQRGASLILSTLRVLDEVPLRQSHQWGQTFVPGLIALPVPRVFWADKPILLPGREFARDFWSVDVRSTLGTSIGIGMPAESFYNFGWAGLLMFPALGVLLRALWERYKHYRLTQSTHIVRAFFLLLVVADVSTPFLNYFGGIAQSAVVYLAFLCLLHLRPPRLVRPRPRPNDGLNGRSIVLYPVTR